MNLQSFPSQQRSHDSGDKNSYQFPIKLLAQQVWDSTHKTDERQRLCP